MLLVPRLLAPRVVKVERQAGKGKKGKKGDYKGKNRSRSPSTSQKGPCYACSRGRCTKGNNLAPIKGVTSPILPVRMPLAPRRGVV
eukprot:9663639-Prorocentrum_lima.AAC.1